MSVGVPGSLGFLISSMLAMMIPSSCACMHPRIDGLPGGAFTMLNLVSMDLFPYASVRLVAPMVSITEPPYPLRTLLVGLMSGRKSIIYRSSVVRIQVSAPVSTLMLMVQQSFTLTLANSLSGCLDTECTVLSEVTVPM